MEKILGKLFSWMGGPASWLVSLLIDRLIEKIAVLWKENMALRKETARLKENSAKLEAAIAIYKNNTGKTPEEQERDADAVLDTINIG
jgi:hypothetical protein